MSNRISIADLGKLPLGQIAALPVEELAMLLEDVEALASNAKKAKDLLGAALTTRYGNAAQAKRQEQGKDCGTVRIDDGPYQVVCDLPKRPKWDQAGLQHAISIIESWGSDPREFVTLEIKVPERSYTAWPSEIRKVFEPARTVETGKPSFELVQKDAAQ